MRREVKRALAYLFALPPPFWRGHSYLTTHLTTHFDYTIEQAATILWDWRKRGCRLRHGQMIRRQRRRARDITRRDLRAALIESKL